MIPDLIVKCSMAVVPALAAMFLVDPGESSDRRASAPLVADASAYSYLGQSESAEIDRFAAPAPAMLGMTTAIVSTTNGYCSAKNDGTGSACSANNNVGKCSTDGGGTCSTKRDTSGGTWMCSANGSREVCSSHKGGKCSVIQRDGGCTTTGLSSGSKCSSHSTGGLGFCSVTANASPGAKCTTLGGNSTQCSAYNGKPLTCSVEGQTQAPKTGEDCYAPRSSSPSPAGN